MFSVYGVTGQTFRGTLEHLVQAPGVLRVRHVRGIHRIVSRGDILRATLTDPPLSLWI